MTAVSDCEGDTAATFAASMGAADALSITWPLMPPVVPADIGLRLIATMAKTANAKAQKRWVRIMVTRPFLRDALPSSEKCGQSAAEELPSCHVPGDFKLQATSPLLWEAPSLIAHTEYLTMNTKKRYEIVDITDEVERVRARAGLKDGFILVSAMHITASVFVNDHEPGLYQDILQWLELLAPAKPGYEHHRTGEDNADAHLKRMLLGHQVIVPVTNGKLDFGPWERVHYGEFDGRRPKRVVLKAIGL